MNEQFVSRVEGPRARTSLPQAGELVFAANRGGRQHALAGSFLALLVPLHSSAAAVRVRRGRFDVPPLDVSHETLLLRKRTATVDPTTLISRREVIAHRFRAICNVDVNAYVNTTGARYAICVRPATLGTVRVATIICKAANSVAILFARIARSSKISCLFSLS